MRQFSADFSSQGHEPVPDDPCEAGDYYFRLMVRCYAAAMLSDRDIARRIMRNVARLDWEEAP